MSILTDHELLVAIFKKDVAILSQQIQWILRIHQYRVRIICKPGLDLFIVDWLSKQKPQRKQRYGNTWHAVECWFHTENCKHSRLHDDTAITTGNLTKWLPTTAQTLYHQRLAREQGWNTRH